MNAHVPAFPHDFGSGNGGDDNNFWVIPDALLLRLLPRNKREHLPSWRELAEIGRWVVAGAPHRRCIGCGRIEQITTPWGAHVDRAVNDWLNGVSA
jgi:hypothetical protein